MVLLPENACVRFTVRESDVTVDPYPELISTQGKGDRKYILCASKIRNDLDAVTICSPFRGTKIVLVMIGFLYKYGT